MALEFQVTLDCADPHALCDFWADVLGYVVEPSDEDFIRRMVTEGQASASDTVVVKGVLRWKEGAACVDPQGVRPRLLLQLAPEGKAVKNRMHLDLRSTDKGAEVARLTALGATTLWEGRQGPHTWVTMADPEGNEFCVS